MANVWSDVTEQPILAIESGTWANVIVNSTCCLQQCIQQLLTHLDNRARALATSGNFEAALKDTIRIRQLAPSSAVGYLCAGHVYSLQGRQKAAIDIYDRGLAAVPSADPAHQQLLEAQSMAQYRDSKKIDFIKEFSINILENIAPWILSKETIAPSEIREYLDVSSVWREKLLLSTRELHIDSLHDDDLGNDDDLLEHIAPYCTALTLQRNTYGFHRLMSKAPFPSLRTLIAKRPRADGYGYDDEDDDDYDDEDDDDYDDEDDVDDVSGDDDDVSGDDDDVSGNYDYDDDDEDASGDDSDDKHFYHPEIAALVSLGSTLTHLEITTSSYAVWLGGILSSCPNLVHLKTYGVDTDMFHGPECHPNLKRLLFWRQKGSSDIDDITKRLPGLEVFAGNPIYDTKALNILQDNCPNLKVVGYNDYDYSYFYVPTTSTTTRSQDQGDQQDCSIGVHTLYVNNHELSMFYVDLEDIIGFMRRNSHTLQHVYFYTELVGEGDDNIRVLNRQIQAADVALFKSMTTFVNHIHNHGDMLLTRWIARGSPHLKEIKLLRNKRYLQSAIDTSALFEDLVGYCELESVIVDLHGDPTTDMGGAERFIRYHGTFDSPLHTLTLPNHTRLSKDELDTLTTLPRLENLSISWPLMKEEDQDDGKCSDFIGKLDRLQHLEIRSDEVFPGDVFVQLSKLNIISLELYVPVLKLRKPTILLSLLQCQNLQELFVSHALGKDEPLIGEIRTMLEAKIEQVNFDEYKW